MSLRSTSNLDPDQVEQLETATRVGYTRIGTRYPCDLNGCVPSGGSTNEHFRHVIKVDIVHTEALIEHLNTQASQSAQGPSKNRGDVFPHCNLYLYCRTYSGVSSKRQSDVRFLTLRQAGYTVQLKDLRDALKQSQGDSMPHTLYFECSIDKGTPRSGQRLSKQPVNRQVPLLLTDFVRACAPTTPPRVSNPARCSGETAPHVQRAQSGRPNPDHLHSPLWDRAKYMQQLDINSNMPTQCILKVTVSDREQCVRYLNGLASSKSKREPDALSEAQRFPYCNLSFSEVSATPSPSKLPEMPYRPMTQLLGRTHHYFIYGDLKSFMQQHLISNGLNVLYIKCTVYGRTAEGPLGLPAIQKRSLAILGDFEYIAVHGEKSDTRIAGATSVHRNSTDATRVEARRVRFDPSAPARDIVDPLDQDSALSRLRRLRHWRLPSSASPRPRLKLGCFS